MPIDYDDMMQSGATGLAARYDERDVMLYALGVGMGRDPLDEKELPFVYENNGLKVMPTFASVINRGEAPPDRQRMPQKSQINFALVVDGERRITVHKPLPSKCEVLSDERVVNAYLGNDPNTINRSASESATPAKRATRAKAKAGTR